MTLFRETNEFVTSVEGNYKGRDSVQKYILGERFNYPASNVLHDICQFSIDRPKGAPDNFRIYTPAVNTYNLEVVSSNANDSNSVANTDAGVKQVKILYLDSNMDEQSVIVDLDGANAVTVGDGSPIDIRRVNDFHSVSTGEWGVARGNITLRTTAGSSIEAPWSGQQILGYIQVGGNKDMTALYTVPRGKKVYLQTISTSSANQDQSIRLRANVDPDTREMVQYNCFLFQSVVLLGSNANNPDSFGNLEFPEMVDIKVSCKPNAGSADSSVHVVLKLIDNQ